MTEVSKRTFTIENEEYKNSKADNQGGRFVGAGFNQVAAKAGRRLLNATGKNTARLKLRETTVGSSKRIHVYKVKLEELDKPVKITRQGENGKVSITIVDKVVVTPEDNGYSSMTPSRFLSN
jgi:hypothetical protein